MNNRSIKPPFLSTGFTEGKTEIKNRFKNILSKGKKNCLFIFFLITAFTVLSGMLVSCGTKEKPNDEQSTLNIDNAVTQALIDTNRGAYLSGECVCEGHIILGSDESENELIVYANTMYGEYGFINGNFEKVSGSGVIPAVITFSKTDDSNSLKNIKYPEDGAGYTDSLKEIFPKKYHNEVLNSEKYNEELQMQEQNQAYIYLKKIGRKAKVGNYADFEHIIPDTYTEISNILINKFPDYPYWTGNQEKLENGVRVIYEKLCEPYGEDKNPKDCVITFRKSNYETKEILEEYVIKVLNGEMVSVISKADSDKKK